MVKNISKHHWRVPVLNFFVPKLPFSSFLFSHHCWNILNEYNLKKRGLMISCHSFADVDTCWPDIRYQSLDPSRLRLGWRGQQVLSISAA